MKAYKGVIFDFNGTLFFDNEKHVLAWNEISRILRKRDISEEELHTKFNGTPNEQNIRYMMEGTASEEQVEEYSQLKEALYRKYCAEDKETFHLVAGVYEYFQLLKDRGIPFTIASASIKPNIDFFRESFGLDEWMNPDNIVYDDGTYENKIAMFLDAAERIGISIEETLIIEDSFSGIRSAYAAGCRKIIAVCEKEKEAEYENLPGVIGTMQTFEQIGKLEDRMSGKDLEASKLAEEFRQGKYQDLLTDIYLDETMILAQEERYAQALEHFIQLYGDKAVEIYSAPGRSEVGGNHTDHQHGKVLAASVNLDAIAIVAKRQDDVIKLKSAGYEPIEMKISNLEPDREHPSTSENLIKGVAYRLKEAGYETGGFEAYVTSNVINGAGLSSSAAFEILIGTIFSGLYNDMEISPVFLAQVGQYAENVFFGKPCGLMDQMACSVGGLIHIDFENPEEPLVHKVDAAFEKFSHSLCIVDTKGSHADLTDDYAAVPAEMKQVAQFFAQSVLREVQEQEFYDKIAIIREAYGDRAVLRAIHFYEENQRVDEQLHALEQGDFETFKALVKASGNSSYKFLQNVYSNHDLKNQSVAIGLAISEQVLGEKGVCRVHGGGFAGTIQAFVPDEFVEEYKAAMEKIFGKDCCYALKVRKYGGMRVL